jgi:uncharacterized membrane protein YqgA involved in biofilm formation
MTGTIVNAVAVAVAGAVGLSVRRHIPEKITDIVFQAIGLVIVVIGVKMALEMQNILLGVISLVAGSVAGQWIEIDSRLERLSEWLRRRVGGASDGAQGRFTEGFVTATMLFCIGSMAILGAIEDGMGNTPTVLYTKSVIDAASAFILAATLGVGVIFSALPVLIYQGALTIMASLLMRYMSDAMLADMTGIGGVMIIGLGINLMRIKEIRVANMLPALVFIVALSYFFN